MALKHCLHRKSMESGHSCTRKISNEKKIRNPLKLGVLVVFHDDKTPHRSTCGCTCRRVFGLASALSWLSSKKAQHTILKHSPMLVMTNAQEQSVQDLESGGPLFQETVQKLRIPDTILKDPKGISWYLMYRGQSVGLGPSQWVSDSLSLSESPTGQRVPKSPYKSLLRRLCSPLSFGSLPSFFSNVAVLRRVKHGEILPCVCILMIGKHDYCNPIDCQEKYSERKPFSKHTI